MVAILLCTMILLRAGIGFAAEEWRHSDILRFEVEGQTLSIAIEDASLADVLDEVARRAKFDLETHGELGRVRSQQFAGVPLKEAIQRLVGDNRVNLVMRYATDEVGTRRLAEVHARAVGQVPAAFLQERRMRTELSRVRIPPPPPPPPTMQ